MIRHRRGACIALLAVLSVAGCLSMNAPGSLKLPEPLQPSELFGDAIGVAERPAQKVSLERQISGAQKRATAFEQARLQADEGGRMPTLDTDCYSDLECFRRQQVLAIAELATAQRLDPVFEEADQEAGNLLERVQSLDEDVERASDADARLSVMVARDQALREIYAERAIAFQRYGNAKNEVLRDWIRYLVRQRDIVNAHYLMRRLEEVPEPRRTELVTANWLIVQHSDRMPELQQLATGLIESLPENPLAGPEWAMLEDRFLLNAFGQQKYGTQVRCVDGHWQRPGLPPPAETDANRNAMGLDPLGGERRRPGSTCKI